MTRLTILFFDVKSFSVFTALLTPLMLTPECILWKRPVRITAALCFYVVTSLTAFEQNHFACCVTGATVNETKLSPNWNLS